MLSLQTNWRDAIMRFSPVVVVVVLCVLNPLVGLCLQLELERMAGIRPPELRPSVLCSVAVLIAEAFFVVVIAGFAHARWLYSYLIGLGVALLFWVACMAGVNNGLPDTSRLMVYSVCFIPGLLLAGACPLYLIRLVIGGRVRALCFDQPVRPQLRIRELLYATALVPSLYVFLRVPLVTWDIVDPVAYWQHVGRGAALMAAGGLTLSPAAMWFVMNARVRWLLLVYTAAVIAPILVAAWLTEPLFDAAVLGTMSVVTTLASVVFACLLSIRISRRTMMQSKRSDARVSAGTNRLGELATLVAVGACIVVAGVVNARVAPKAEHRWKVWRWAEAEARRKAKEDLLSELADARGGRFYDGVLTLGPGTGDDLQFLKDFHDEPKGLDLTGSAVTSDLLAACSFPQLFRFTANETDLTDDALVCLHDAIYLSRLYASGTNIEGVGLRRVASLEWVVFDNSQFSDQGCAELGRFPSLTRVSLADNRVTDEGVRHLAPLPLLHYLSLAGTDITDDSVKLLRAAHSLYTLDLRRTGFTGKDLTTADWPPLRRLLLDETLVTDATLGSVSQHLTHLSLRDTAITDDGLANLKQTAEIESLDLAGTHVTGRGFQHWSVREKLACINLARTEVDDEGVRSMLAVASPVGGNRFQVSLARTSVTDDVLPDLVKAAAPRRLVLDLRETAATGRGILDAILDANLPTWSRVILTNKQASPEELAELRERVYVDVQSGVTTSDDWPP